MYTALLISAIDQYSWTSPHHTYVKFVVVELEFVLNKLMDNDQSAHPYNVPVDYINA